MFKFIKIFMLVSVLFIHLISECITLRSSVRGLVKGGNVERLIRLVLDNDTSSFNDMMEKQDFKNNSAPIALKKIYYVTRAVKELSRISCWYRKRKTEAKTLREVYLFAHVIDGHFLSPTHDQDNRYSTIPGAWRCTDATWSSTSGLNNFLQILVNIFTEIRTSPDRISNIVVQENGRSFTISIRNNENVTRENINLSKIYVDDNVTADYNIPTGGTVMQKPVERIKVTLFTNMDATKQTYLPVTEDKKTELMTTLKTPAPDGGPMAAVVGEQVANTIVSTVSCEAN
jgi:hypothetical protein